MVLATSLTLGMVASLISGIVAAFFLRCLDYAIQTWELFFHGFLGWVFVFISLSLLTGEWSWRVSVITFLLTSLYVLWMWRFSFDGSRIDQRVITRLMTGVGLMLVIYTFWPHSFSIEALFT